MKNLLLKSLLLCIVLTALLCPWASAAETASGSCGNSVYRTLYDTGELYIHGTGDMTDYRSSSRAPWYDHGNDIKTVTIEDGVTSIGNYAFYACTALTGITIPDSVTAIGYEAFGGCSGLYVVAIGGKPLQADDYTISCDDSTIGKQTVTVSYMGLTATFDILIYDESGVPIYLGSVNLPQDIVAYCAAYDESGKMLHCQNAVLVSGSVQFSVPGDLYDDIAQFRLFVPEEGSLVPLRDLTAKEKEDL